MQSLVSAYVNDLQRATKGFDNQMVNHFVEEFKRQYQKDTSQSNGAVRCRQSVRVQIVPCPPALRPALRLTLSLRVLISTPQPHEHVLRRLTWIGTLEPAEKALQDANITGPSSG